MRARALRDQALTIQASAEADAEIGFNSQAVIKYREAFRLFAEAFVVSQMRTES